MDKDRTRELEERIRQLEGEALESARIKRELLAERKLLKQQNVSIIRKSLDLSDIKRDLEDKNLELETIRAELKRQNINLVRKSIQLSDVMRTLEDINYDLESSQGNLEESRKRFRNLTESTSDWVWEVDAHGVYIYSSPKVEDLLGYKPHEIIGKTAFSLMPGAEADRVSAAFFEAARKKAPIERLENTNAHKDGRLVVLETSGVPVLDGQGALLGYRGIDRDITEHKALQTQLIQAKKMEAIGQLAGGVAHDFNNLLTPILGLVELMLTETDPLDQRFADLKQIRESALRGQDLTNQILAFGRRQMLEMKTVSLGRVVAEFEDTLRRTIRENIDLSMISDPEDDPVRADVSQIKQILLNLAANAQDAMPDGGTIRIRTSRVYLDESFHEVGPSSANADYVKLEFSDTGCGIETPILKRIFEPFFTTKEVGRGTGLGLATVHGIVNQHGGHIAADSSPGQGTTFRLHFPLGSKDDGEDLLPDSLEVGMPGQATIVVVEDEPIVREVVARILRAHGYEVFSAANAEDCLELMDRELPSFDLLLTDVVMPRTNGRELFLQVAERAEGVKVLYMSGYPQEVIASQGILDDGTNFIQKPVSAQSLIPGIQRILRS